MVVSVDVQFVVKSTNEHPYYSLLLKQADCDRLRDYLRHDVLQSGLRLVLTATYLRKFQLKPHSSAWFTPGVSLPLHVTTIISISTMQLLKMSPRFC